MKQHIYLGQNLLFPSFSEARVYNPASASSFDRVDSWKTLAEIPEQIERGNGARLPSCSHILSLILKASLSSHSKHILRPCPRAWTSLAACPLSSILFTVSEIASQPDDLLIFGTWCLISFMASFGDPREAYYAKSIPPLYRGILDLFIAFIHGWFIWEDTAMELLTGCIRKKFGEFNQHLTVRAESKARAKYNS